MDIQLVSYILMRVSFLLSPWTGQRWKGKQRTDKEGREGKEKRGGNGREDVPEQFIWTSKTVVDMGEGRDPGSAEVCRRTERA